MSHSSQHSGHNIVHCRFSTHFQGSPTYSILPWSNLDAIWAHTTVSRPFFVQKMLQLAGTAANCFPAPPDRGPFLLVGMRSHQNGRQLSSWINPSSHHQHLPPPSLPRANSEESLRFLASTQAQQLTLFCFWSRCHSLFQILHSGMKHQQTRIP